MLFHLECDFAPEGLLIAIVLAFLVERALSILSKHYRSDVRESIAALCRVAAMWATQTSYVGIYRTARARGAKWMALCGDIP